MKKEITLREHLKAAGSVKTAKKAASSRENGKKGGRMPAFAGKIYERINLIIEDWNEENKEDYEGKLKKFIDENWNCCHVSERQFIKADGTHTAPLSTEYALTIYSRFCTENSFRNRVKNPENTVLKTVYLNDDHNAIGLRWTFFKGDEGFWMDETGNVTTFNSKGFSKKKRYGIPVPLEDISESERKKIEKYL